MADRRKIVKTLCFLACGVLGVMLLRPATVRADHIVMHDGSTRDGTVLSHDDQTLLLRMGEGGLSMTVRIPMSSIAEVHITPKPHPYIPPTSNPAATLPAATRNSDATPGSATPSNSSATTSPATRPQLVRSTQHFFREWLLLGLGQNATNYDSERLPADQAQLWTKSLQDDADKDTNAELTDLTALATAQDPDIRLLNKLSYRYHHMLFGPRLGQLRWMIIQSKGGAFDLSGITAIETPTLIGLMRAATPGALEPLKHYYPLPAAAYEGRKSSRPHDPLSDIQVSGDLALKEKAAFAIALISAQLKLEPDMPLTNQIYLRQILAKVQAVFGKCLELEPLARAAAEKEEREQKARELKQKQDAELQNSLTPPGQ